MAAGWAYRAYFFTDTPPVASPRAQIWITSRGWELRSRISHSLWLRDWYDLQYAKALQYVLSFQVWSSCIPERALGGQLDQLRVPVRPVSNLSHQRGWRSALYGRLWFVVTFRSQNNKITSLPHRARPLRAAPPPWGRPPSFLLLLSFLTCSQSFNTWFSFQGWMVGMLDSAKKKNIALCETMSNLTIIVYPILWLYLWLSAPFFHSEDYRWL